MLRAAAVALLLLSASAGTALADKRPPADAMPLSQIIALVEQRADLDFIKEVDWDDDGYYEIEYRVTGGGNREIKIDPVTGAER